MCKSLVKLNLPIYILKKAKGKILILEDAPRALLLLPTITLLLLLLLACYAYSISDSRGLLSVALGLVTASCKKHKYSKPLTL